MSLSLLGGNMPTLRHQNRVAVLNVLLRFGPLSRSDACKITRLTPATMTNIVSELLEAGLVTEAGSRSPNGSGVGRRHVMVDLNPDGAFAVGVHLGVRAVLVGLGNLKGQILRRISFSVRPGDDPHSVLQSTAEAISTVVRESGVDRQRLLGVGVGCAGLVDPETGSLKSMYHHGWHDMPVAGVLERALRLPVVVENNRNAMAMAESTFGLGQKVGDFALVHVHTTIGASIVIGHRVHHGSNNAAGQIGHLVLEQDGPCCSCGQHGCLDTLASHPAIVRQATQLIEKTPGSLLARLFVDKGGQLEAEDVFRAAVQCDPASKAIVAQAGAHLGRAIGHVVRITSPELVIVVGPIFETGDLVMKPLAEAALSDTARVLGLPTRIVPTGFGSDLMVAGGVSLALLRFLYAAEPDVRSDEGPRRYRRGVPIPGDRAAQALRVSPT